MEPIVYVSGGLFGDFIHQLSVICELWYKTNRKGVLYISNHGDSFRFGVEKAYNDTYSVLIKQPYIEKYEIYNGQTFNIDLSEWRRSKLLYTTNWYHIFKDWYKVEWGSHCWINVVKDDKWSNKILISTNSYRFPLTIDFKKLYEKYLGQLLFFSQSREHYDHFIKETELDIPFYKVNSFEELCQGIASCKLFVGNLSSPLAIGMATHANCLIGLTDQINDDKHYMNFDKFYQV